MYLSLSLRKTFGVFLFPLPFLMPECGLEDKVIYFILSFLSSFSPYALFQLHTLSLALTTVFS